MGTLSTAAQSHHTRQMLVAVIDANAEHREQLEGALHSFYRVKGFSDGGCALDQLADSQPSVLVVDEQARHDGGCLLNQIRRDQRYAHVPLIRTTRHINGSDFDPVADAVLSKPFRKSVLLKTIAGLVTKQVEKRWLTLPELQRSTLVRTVEVFNDITSKIDRGEPLEYRALGEACQPLVEVVARNDYRSLLDSVRGHDNYSYVHSLRVGTILSLFGHAIGLRDDDLLLLASGGLVHDIGKMAIPHMVLNKPGRLTPEEWQVMKSHVGHGKAFLEMNSNVPAGVVTIAAQHHEKLDGSGYPMGLKGRELNDLARMAVIADVFSALTDRRIYKSPMVPEKALRIMTTEMVGLDQSMLRLFREMLLDAVPVI